MAGAPFPDLLAMFRGPVVQSCQPEPEDVVMPLHARTYRPVLYPLILYSPSEPVLGCHSCLVVFLRVLGYSCCNEQTLIY